MLALVSLNAQARIPATDNYSLLQIQRWEILPDGYLALYVDSIRRSVRIIH